MRDPQRDDDESIRFLLSAGRLSGADHDRIIARIRRAPAPPRRSWWWLLGLGSVTSGAVAALVMVIGFGRQQAPDGGGLTAKGQAETGPVLSARCPGRPRGICRVGDRLIFEVDGATTGGLLAAFAERPSGDRIWYFPTKEGHLAAVPANSGASVIGEAARIGDEHGAGRYTLRLFVVDHPVDRATLSAGKAHARAEVAFPLEVQP